MFSFFFRFFTFDVDFRFSFLSCVFYLYFILTIANIYFCMSVINIGNIWSICRIMWELGGPWVSSVRYLEKKRRKYIQEESDAVGSGEWDWMSESVRETERDV